MHGTGRLSTSEKRFLAFSVDKEMEKLPEIG